MAKKYIFWDTETFSAGREYGMPPEEFTRLFQYAVNDGPVKTTTDYQEMLGILRDSDYIIGHNIVSYDLRVLFGVDSLEPLEMALAGKVIDTFVLASLITPAPYSYTNSKGHTFYDAASPEQAKKWLALDNLCFQFDLPGKFGDLAEIAKRYNPPKTLRRDLDFGLIPLDDEEFLEYADQDVIAVRGLYYYLVGQIKEQDYNRDYIWREMIVWSINAQISKNGVRVDIAEAQDRVAHLQAERDEVMDWLVAEFDFPTGGKQPWKSSAGKEAIVKALKSFGIHTTDPKWTRTASGAPSFSGDTMKAVTEGTEAEKLGTGLATLQGQRSLAALALESVKEDGKAHPDIMCLQRSGRTSVQRPGLTIWTARGPGAVEKRYFLADEGHVMVEADFSAADARAVAAVSGDAAFSKRFEPGVDSHDISGEIFFGRDAYHANREELRPVAKACIAEGERVLTDSGLVPIEDVTTDHLVWDGLKFTTHGGIVYNGVKEVITYEGLTATEDHVVFARAGGETVEVPLGVAAAEHLRLITTGAGGREVRVDCGDLDGGEVLPGGSEPASSSAVPRVPSSGLGVLRESSPGLDPRVPSMRTAEAEAVPSVAREEDGCYPAEMPEPEQSGVQELRGPWGPVPLGLDTRSGIVDLEKPGTLRAGDDPRQDRHQRELRAGESEVGRPEATAVQQALHSAVGVPSGALAVCPGGGASVPAPGVFTGRDHRGSSGERQDERVALQPRGRKTRVYDILNAGPHHRFTVSGKLVHNCSHALAYRVGARKLGETAGADFETGKRFIENYQKAYPLVTRWQNKITLQGDNMGFVENHWGRRMTVDEGRSFNQSSALIGQSTTREMLFDGLIRIAKADINQIRTVRMIVHDAVVFSIPREGVEDTVEWLMDKMQAVFSPGDAVSLDVEFPMGVGPLDQTDWYNCAHG